MRLFVRDDDDSVVFLVDRRQRRARNGMTAGNLRPVPEARKWNFELAADFSQADIGNTILGRQFSERKVPHFLVQFVTVLRRILIRHEILLRTVDFFHNS